jgi:hypothetical protein
MWKGFWDWLAALPQGSASFIGTLTGSTLGLIALLLGALFNAHLTRRRDDRLRDEDRVALASALSGIHRTLIENAQHLTERPADPDGGFVVPEPSMKLLPGTLPKIGLLQPETIRKVMDAYVLTEQYVEQLILFGGRLQSNMPDNRRLVYLDAARAKLVIEPGRRHPM